MSVLAPLAAAWRDAVGDELAQARELRRAIHASPCVSGKEEPTSRLVEEVLADAAVRLERVAETGRIGRVGPAGGPSIVLRAELDALPVAEQTGASYAATNGAMHACGHDVHLAALVAVTRAAARLERACDRRLPFGLVPVFQPREETYPSGAEQVVGSGRLDHHGVRCCVAAHVHPGVPEGHIAVGQGFVNAAADEFEVIVDGRGGHAAYPHQAADVVAPLAAIALALPETVRRTIAPVASALISVGTVQAGNGAPNVLPATGRLYGTMRTTSADDRRALASAIADVAVGIATGYGVRASTRIISGEPVLVNDPDLAVETARWIDRFGYAQGEPIRSLGADDFSYFTAASPGLMAFVGVGSADGSSQRSLHDPRFLPGDHAVDAVADILLAGYLAAASLLGRERSGDDGGAAAG